MGDGGSGCASSGTSGENQAREPAKLLPLQAPTPIFAGSPSIPSALGASPTFSTPQDHPDAPSAAKETNTVWELPTTSASPACLQEGAEHQPHTSRVSSVAPDDWDD